MMAIQLHNYEEEIVGTVFLEVSSNYNTVCDKWDEYLKEYGDNATVRQFEELYGEEDLFDDLNVDFYQPSKN